MSDTLLFFRSYALAATKAAGLIALLSSPGHTQNSPIPAIVSKQEAEDMGAAIVAVINGSHQDKADWIERNISMDARDANRGLQLIYTNEFGSTMAAIPPAGS